MSKRFVPLKDRHEFSMVLDRHDSDLYTKNIYDAKNNFHFWKGRKLVKDPMTLTTYLQLIQELKPKTVIEFGTYLAGSALWIKDMTESLGQECDIYTFDINNVEVPDKIIFYQINNYNFIDFVNENYEMFENMEHPILVIEDSHENVLQLLWIIDKFLKSGDYIVVEDSLNAKKYSEMKIFVERVGGYLVDTHYCDFWGYNNSWNVNSYLVKE